MSRNNLHLLLLLLVTFLSRLPFLWAGYGVEEDSWGIVQAIRQTCSTGIYEASRLPGHPLHEAVYLLAPYAGPLFYNGTTALMSTLAVLFFALSLRQLGLKNYLLPSYAFAFVPVFYISSTYTIDFNWTLAFLLASFYFLLRKRIVAAGTLLGLAVGCRLTAGAMLLPFLLYLYHQRAGLLAGIKLVIPTLVVGFICFLPLLYRYGAEFFHYYDQFAYPPLPKVLYKASIGVFGLLGCIALLVALVHMLRNRFRIMPENFKGIFPKGLVSLCLLTIVLYIISYLRLPQKSGYMLTIVPFVIILLVCLVKQKKLRWIFGALLLSPFIFSINLTDDKRGAEYSSLAIPFKVAGQEVFFDPITGPVYADYSKRRQKMAYTDWVISEAQRKSEDFIVISGWWYNEIVVTLEEKGLSSLQRHFVFYINEEKMNALSGAGNVLYYLPEQDRFNDEYSKMNLTQKLARPFDMGE